MNVRPPLLLIALLTASALQAAGPPPDPALFKTKAPWVPDPELVASLGKRRPESNYDESKVPPWSLPPWCPTRARARGFRLPGGTVRVFVHGTSAAGGTMLLCETPIARVLPRNGEGRSASRRVG